MIDVDVEVKGLIELQRKTERMVAELRGVPILNAMRDSTLLVTRYGKQNAPVDTGRLRASIIPSVGISGSTVEGVVGSNVEYAPYQEYGTRRGITPKRYLGRAMESAEPYIVRRFDQAVQMIIR